MTPPKPLPTAPFGNDFWQSLYGLTEEEIRIVEGADTTSRKDELSESPSKSAALPRGKSTPQSEADAAHFYSAKEDPVPYRTANSAEQKGD